MNLFAEYAEDLNCLHCGAKNRSAQWPEAGDLVPFYNQKEPGQYTVTVHCPNCNKDWYVVWDDNPGAMRQLESSPTPTAPPQPAPDPAKADALAQRGLESLRAGNADDAITHLSTALQHDANHFGALQSLGLAHGMKGDHAQAATHLEAALRVNSNAAPAHFNLGVVYIKQGKQAEAIREMEAALRLEPDYPQAQKALAELQSQVNRAASNKQIPISVGGERREPGVTGTDVDFRTQRSGMVLIPAGEFLMGSNDCDNEKPQRRVYLDDYYIDRYPVTVAQYREYCRATKRLMPDAPSWGWKDDHPVVNVTWHNATAYAAWAGKRLPTEAEWEKAARGTDGRKFPWGNKSVFEEPLLCMTTGWAKLLLRRFLRGWQLGRSLALPHRRCHCSKSSWGDANSTAPVGGYPQGVSPYGVHDMAGNVWEWCTDQYGSDYYNRAPARNPQGPASGFDRVARGASWENSSVDIFRCSYRIHFTPENRGHAVGFRCVVCTDTEQLLEPETEPAPTPAHMASSIVPDTDALCNAARKGDIQAMEQQLDAGAGVNSKDRNGMTALHHAAGDNQVEAARFLVSKGADLEAKSNGGFTPLAWAMKWMGNVEIVRLLLDSGADVNGNATPGNTPLDLAIIRGGLTDVEQLLRERGANTQGEDLMRKLGLV